MFVVLLSYKKPLEEVDAALAPHCKYLERYLANGTMLLAGPQQPRSGGVILVRAASRAQVEALIEGDPFHQQDLADYQIIEFVACETAPALAAFLETA